MSEVFYTLPTNDSVVKLSEVTGVSHIYPLPAGNNYAFRIFFNGASSFTGPSVAPPTPPTPANVNAAALGQALTPTAPATVHSNFLVVDEDESQLATYRTNFINSWVSQANGTLV